MSEHKPLIGIIGGSGLYNIPGLSNIEEIEVSTPFGDPSDKLVLGDLEGVKVVFLARHGRHHHLTPSEVPFRANIYALKKLGVKYILSASAVGSLKEEVKPLDIVLVDQFVDRTKHRKDTFFENGIVAHVPMGDPVCPSLTAVVRESILKVKKDDITLHYGGTYVNMEGPAFSTKAESNIYRSWGASVIGMTNFTEAKLAKEAEIAYCSISMVTDYDCWHEDFDSVSVEMVIQNLHKNAETAKEIIRQSVQDIGNILPPSKSHDVLKTSIVTNLNNVPIETYDKLSVILEKYKQ